MGITWTDDNRSTLETESPFQLKNCQCELEFNFKDQSECFPRSTAQGNAVAD